jgi:FlaA1/EpsC-like NDP-sugar epimerase
LSRFEGKRVLVTGGVGSIGAEITRQLVREGAATVRVIDNNESGLFDLEQIYRDHAQVECICCDVSDEHEMMRVLAGMDFCFHAAALKHVPSCERSPFSAVNVNIDGVENVIRAAMATGVQRVLFTSSDKAVNPTNVMGTSKLMGERLMTAANFLQDGRAGQTVFASTRFGNVAGSRGSVVPLFCNQIARGGPVTITDPRMTRFIMSTEQAVELVIESMFLAKGGEVFVTKMPVIRIVDLATTLIELVAPVHGRHPKDVPIRYIGKRPGEKLWEELSTEEESHRILEGERYLVILPALRALLRDAESHYTYPGLALQPSDAIYHSEHESKMTKEEIVEFLLAPGVLPDEIRPRALELRRLSRGPSAKVA